MLKLLIFLACFYLLICGLLFFFQEHLIFFPEKLDRDHQFGFNQKFEEIFIKAKDQKLLHGLLFKAENSNGLIFYLHGNAGSLRSWGEVAQTYTDLNYDVFMIDYRGFGKSEGSISNQAELHQDVQLAYDEMKARYSEDQIVVLGYSVGSGLAAKLASSNNPEMLILQAPYYSMTDLMKNTYPIIPTALLKYKLETNEYIISCRMPIVLFHGRQDEIIYHRSSVKLRKIMKTTDTLITLDPQSHNGMTSNPEYRTAIQKILMK
ncbi:alpha/beta hydrolase [Flavihumibacter sp. R14]|nr:alpha/beta hydrolase [Flavihumibacter soli]